MRYDYSYDYMNPFAAAWWLVRAAFSLVIIGLLCSLGLMGVVILVGLIVKASGG
jgi:hypothetical protein